MKVIKITDDILMTILENISTEEDFKKYYINPRNKDGELKSFEQLLKEFNAMFEVRYIENE